MSLKLSDKQREFLSAAAEREDGLLAIPPQLKGATAQKVGAKLVAAGLAKEVKAKSGGPVWRRDAETEQAYALKLTAAGLNAVGVDARSQSETVGAAVNDALPRNRPARRASRARSMLDLKGEGVRSVGWATGYVRRCSPVTSRSNWAKDKSTFKVNRPMLVVVLNAWVTE